MQPDWEVWTDVHISPAIAKWMKEFTSEEVKSAYVLSIQNLVDMEVYTISKNAWKRHPHFKRFRFSRIDKSSWFSTEIN